MLPNLLSQHFQRRRCIALLPTCLPPDCGKRAFGNMRRHGVRCDDDASLSFFTPNLVTSFLSKHGPPVPSQAFHYIPVCHMVILPRFDLSFSLPTSLSYSVPF